MTDAVPTRAQPSEDGRRSEAGEPRARWTREQLVEFLEREKPKYQRIELPYGLSTDGEDRRETAERILPERMDGKSLLDIGCFLGFFEHEALRRGAARAVGIDINPDRLRQARGLAECLGLPVEFHRCDLEHDELPGRFDTVLCLNVLHHVYDPVAALDRLLRATKERLVLEMAGTWTAVMQGLLWPRNPARAALYPLIKDQPLTVVGKGDSKRAYGFHYISQGALENMLLHHRGDVARVDTLRSPFRDRYLVVVWKRRIDHLAVVAGLPGSGKSTLSQRLIGGELPELRTQLGMDRAPAWTFSGPRLLAQQTEPHVPAMLFHYDIMRGSPIMKVSFDRDPTLDVVRSHPTTAPSIFLWTDPKLLRERLEKRRQGITKKREDRVLRHNVRFLEDARRTGVLISDWLRWCARTGLRPTFVDCGGEPTVLTEAEFRGQAAAAGCDLDA
ncbi:MAG: methyltransferase domain-containing protein [Planctomycetes bacterium]|nr:methyltransferase domain-containing protein [Planctomycetota bacterium]